MELHEIVLKLVGPVHPVGETYADSARLENLKQLMALTDRLLSEINQVSFCATRHEASMAEAGKLASRFLGDVRDG